jgi:isopenicillin-N epimerase
MLSQPLDLSTHWSLDPDVIYLNHGSFGACPTAVLGAQQRFRNQLEREPLRFFSREFEPLLDRARETLAQFIGADPAELVFVPNATTGVNSVLRSLVFEPGDELLTTSHAYNACRNALEFVAQRSGAKITIAPIPFPIESTDQVVQAVLDCVSPRTKLALLDHITSQTALILPIQTLVQKLAEQGIDTLWMVPMRLEWFPLIFRILVLLTIRATVISGCVRPRGLDFFRSGAIAKPSSVL